MSKRAPSPCLSSSPKAVLLAFYLHPSPSSKTLSPSLHLSVLPPSLLLTVYIPPPKSFLLTFSQQRGCSASPPPRVGHQSQRQPDLPSVATRTAPSQKPCWDFSETPRHGDRFLQKVSLSADCHFLTERKPTLVKSNLDTAAPRTARAKFISLHCKHPAARH